MYIQLGTRTDRLGSNITHYVAQILFAVHKKLYIRYTKDSLQYSDSLFVQALCVFMDRHNLAYADEDFKHELDVSTTRDAWGNTDWCYTMSRTVKCIEKDLISYVQDNTPIRDIFLECAREKKYTLPFDPARTILVHLRLDDVSYRRDYDGSHCANFYKERMNGDIECMDRGAQSVFGHDANWQAPLSIEKIQTQIDAATAAYPDSQVLLLAAPNSHTTLPYTLLSSDDYNYDLYLLTMCQVVILSRSTFAYSALLFGHHRTVYAPLWGHFVCCGLGTKYDRKHYNYFY